MRDPSLIASRAFECPDCEDWMGTRVIETRMAHDGEAVIRHRRCVACGRTFSTAEVAVGGARLTRGQVERVVARIDAAMEGR